MTNMTLVLFSFSRGGFEEGARGWFAWSCSKLARKLFTVSAAGLPRQEGPRCFSKPEECVRCREQNSTRAGSSSPIPFALEVGGNARVELFFTQKCHPLSLGVRTVP